MFYRILIILGIIIASSNGADTVNLHSTHDGLYVDDQYESNITIKNTVAAGYLLAHKTDLYLNHFNSTHAKLSEILDRNGPDMRSSRDYKDFKDISVDVAALGWTLFHEHASKAIRDRIDLAEPVVSQFLNDAQVSDKCRDSVRELFEGGRKMESWAIKLLNSWGTFPPAGIFEGTYGDLGAYNTCVNIPKGSPIDHAHYCSMTFRPVIPSRADYDLVISRLPDGVSKLFEQSSNNNHSRDAFTDILEHAQYHHFVYYKLGTCWPINCTPFDVKRISKLIGRQNILLNGPVKCFSRYKDDYEEAGSLKIPGTKLSDNSTVVPKKLVISIWDVNDGIFISKPHFLTTQKVALAVLVLITGFILLMTGIDLFAVRIPQMFSMIKYCLLSNPIEDVSNVTEQTVQIELNGQDTNDKTSPETNTNQQSIYTESAEPPIAQEKVLYKKVAGLDRDQLPCIIRWAEDCSIITNAKSFFHVSQGQLKNDILCLNGIRCITMAWICMTHTLMYCDYSGFARTREIEKSLKSLIGQPLFNGSYLVDSFFLMSGLLGAYTSFKGCKGQASRFNAFSYVIGRWLRLTPQIFFVNLIFMVLPAISDGPLWYPLVAEYSENCINNWWINLLHAQAFFRTEKMCNFVTWWVSIDFFYHMMALTVILIILWGNHKIGLITIMGLISAQVAWQMKRHYDMSLPPNVFSTIPQTGAMWTDMTLNFFWKPYAHAVPYFFGFYVGYLMAMKKKLIQRFLNPKRAIIGWSTSVIGLVCLSYSTFWWVTGKATYTRLVATIFYAICPIVWNGSLCWIIVACYYGYGGFLNRFLSSRSFIIMGKSSYLIYLSHFHILFIFFGNANVLLEPTELIMFYIILGNIFLSTLYGILLCIVYECPWLKTHSKLMKYVQLVGQKLC